MVSVLYFLWRQAFIWTLDAHHVKNIHRFLIQTNATEGVYTNKNHFQ